MPRAKSNTSVERAPRVAQFNERDRHKLGAIAGRDDLPDSFFDAVRDAVQEFVYFERGTPTPAQIKRALKEIDKHARALRDLLGNRADEAAEPMRSMRRAAHGIGNETLLGDLRACLDDLVDVVSQTSDSRLERASRKDNKAILAARCDEILRSVDIPVTVTNEDGLPNSPYTRLVKWAFDRAGVGAQDAVKVAIRARKDVRLTD